jgi:plasmid stabilization system protein ParE
MANVRWSAAAKESFEDALAFIARENPRNAMLVRDRVLNTLRHLESFSLGLPAPKGHFKLYIPKTSYFVVFSRGKNDQITLLAFIHAARDWEQFDWDKI